MTGSIEHIGRYGYVYARNAAGAVMGGQLLLPGWHASAPVHGRVRAGTQEAVQRELRRVGSRLVWVHALMELRTT